MIPFSARRAVRFASVAAATVMLAVACGTTLTLNNENLQVAIANWVQTNYGVTAQVSCPDDRPIKQGDVFQCQAVTSDGQQVTFEVTQTDDTGNVSWRVI